MGLKDRIALIKAQLENLERKNVSELRNQLAIINDIAKTHCHYNTKHEASTGKGAIITYTKRGTKIERIRL